MATVTRTREVLICDVCGEEIIGQHHTIWIKQDGHDKGQNWDVSEHCMEKVVDVLQWLNLTVGFKFQWALDKEKMT